MSITVIIPTYNHANTIEKTVDSVLSQAPKGSSLYDQVAIVVCDDASIDDTVAVVERLSQNDKRISFIVSPHNQGTLLNRKQGVLSATTPWVMLMDADDELAAGALEKLLQEAKTDPAQILHFGVEIVAENNKAYEAAAGMEHFLTPPVRSLQDDTILQIQFSESNGFDWHVHHKLYDRELLQNAYTAAADTFLILSDDIYLCFIIDSLAHSYRAIPQAPWYRYHLGAGDTFGNAMDLKHLSTLAQAEADAYKLMDDYANSPQAPMRKDWADRLRDAKERIIFHTMNEWYDNLPDKDRPAGIDLIISAWQPVGGLPAMAAELWRFIRDEAYGLWITEDRATPQAQTQKQHIDSLLEIVTKVEAHSSFDATNHYRYDTMKAVAQGHLRDLRMWPEYLSENQASQVCPQSNSRITSTNENNSDSWLHRIRLAVDKIISPSR